MSARTVVLVLLASSLAACAAPAAVAPPSVVYDDGPPALSAGLFETPRVAPPVNDIPESKRREWLEAQRPKVVYVPQQVVERVVVREPVRYVRTYDRCDDSYWAPRFSWSLGWWGGRHHRRSGWGWGVGLRDGWCW
jgi:hypothetical protein